MLISASVSSCLLVETLGKNMEDYVDEEKETMQNPEVIASLDVLQSNDSKRKFEKLNEEAEISK